MWLARWFSSVQPAVVTISAPYGAGGPIVGRAVADRLGVPFLDRAIPTSVARSLAVSVSDAEAHDERADTRIFRMLAALASAGVGTVSGPPQGPPPEAFRQQTEQLIRSSARTAGCVVLGRAAVLVLHDHPRSLHVCLTGPLERRIRQAMVLGDAADDERAMRKLVEDTDRNRKAYFRHFYRADPDDPSLYHMMIDSTILDLETCSDLIETAARCLHRPGPE
jgi:cytidylate kinase